MTRREEMGMNVFERAIRRTSNGMVSISGILLCFIMCISISDVIMRNLGRPIIGTYELVSLSGGFLAGFALPHSFLNQAHVRVDILVEKLSPAIQKGLERITRALGLLFILIAILFFWKMSVVLLRTSTVSTTLGIPMYLVVFGIIAGSLVQCLVFIRELLSRTGRSQNE
jgi:TRAP-type C4-dicarboxylate transport system permease small subunit